MSPVSPMSERREQLDNAVPIVSSLGLDNPNPTWRDGVIILSDEYIGYLLNENKPVGSDNLIISQKRKAWRAGSMQLRKIARAQAISDVRKRWGGF